MVEISFPSPLVGGGSRCCYPVEISCPGAVLIGWPFFVARDLYGCARESLKIDLVEKDADVDGDDVR